MASIVVITDPYDQSKQPNYLLYRFFQHWQASGHRVLVHQCGSIPPDGDLAILHVDRTVIAPRHLVGIDRFARVINGGVLDISKKSFSRHLLHRGDVYSGPVISKTDLNCGGLPEKLEHRVSLKRDRSPSGLYRRFKYKLGRLLDIHPLQPYRVHDSLSAVPRRVWHSKDMVVEKFLPEQDEHGYYLRTWLFFGNREHCNRVRSVHPIVKGRDTLERTPVPVPDELREWRARLKFDYGKFDFVVRDGEVILFDVNRTPTVPERLSGDLLAIIPDLAAGLDDFLK